MALQHQRIAVAHLRCRLADGDRAGHVGGAVQVLGAGVHQQQRAGLGLAHQPPGRAVVHDGAVGAGAGDGVERQVLERAGGLAEGLQFRHDLHLVRQADLGLGGQPVQEAGQRSAVAAVRLPGAFDLRLVLAGLGQGAGVERAHRRGAGLAQHIGVPGRGLAWVDKHPLTLQLAERAGQLIGRLQPHLVAQPGRELGGHLGRIQEQPG